MGVASLSYSYCSKRPIHGDSTYQQYGAKCRLKRHADEYSLPRKKQSISKEVHIHLETSQDLFEKQQIRDNIEDDGTECRNCRGPGVVKALFKYVGHVSRAETLESIRRARELHSLQHPDSETFTSAESINIAARDETVF